MKNFNLSTTVLSILIISASLILQTQIFGQGRNINDDLNPPTDLSATIVDENDVSLFWLAPFNADSTHLHWDDGVNYTSFGNFIVPTVMDYAAKWDPDHIETYDGWVITEMRFYVVTPMPTIHLKIWTGPDATESYSQELTDWNVNDWTVVTLDTPFTIDADTELWAGLNIDMPVTGASMGCSEGPAISGNGDNYQLNGVWELGGLNWNIQIKVETAPARSLNNLLGYNVYRNDEQINENTLTATSYLDENLLNDTYDYYVTAIYDAGESITSDTVEVIIDQPGILLQDSLALVDLYYECNGANWSLNELWLEGPVNEWRGITTEGNRVTKIHLQSNGLTGDIPTSIGDLTALESLHIESNSINSIPDNIGDLEALKEFWLGWNPISSVPSSIGDLSSLEQLHLGSMETPLGTLPSTFGNLSSLNWLALGGSGLNSLPENFGNLTALESCFIWENNFTELPEGFGGLESLVYLSMYDNQLTSLPESFGNLSNLEQLFMEDNQLTSLPESFGNLSSLFMLRFEYNQLSQLPESFGDLDNLSWLFAYGNQLTSLPESFGSLETLDSLYLFSNQLTSLPESFGNLSDLNLASLEHNYLTELPASFGSLATIDEVYLNDNQLQALPEEFGNMPELLLLVVSENNLSVLPESICDLPKLELFYASKNQLEEIPENFGNLSSLKLLVMDMNNITEIPESLSELSLLEVLSLNHNNINSIPEGLGDLEVDAFAVGDNNISELPSSMFDNDYEYLWVQENALQFGSLEPFVGNVNIEYSYYEQARIGVDTIIDVPYGEVISYTIEVTGDDNIYNWYKDGNLMPNQITNTLYIENPSNGDIGIYVLKVTNTTITDLELVSHDFIVSDITDIENNIDTEFEMYPNPVAGNTVHVAVNNPATVDRIIIMNVSGQVVASEMNVNKHTGMNISKLSEGMYILKVEFNNGDYKTKKLLVK